MPSKARQLLVHMRAAGPNRREFVLGRGLHGKAGRFRLRPASKDLADADGERRQAGLSGLRRARVHYACTAGSNAVIEFLHCAVRTPRTAIWAAIY